MKKGLILVWVCLFVIVSVLGQSSDNLDSAGGQYDDVVTAIDKIPIDDSGKIDSEKVDSAFDLGKSKAEQRIDAVNAWIAEYGAWLRFGFGMIPQISWMFLWVVYWMVFMLTHGIFNARQTWFFFDKTWQARVFGVAVFVILVAANAYVSVARLIVSIIGTFWHTILPWGIAIAVVLVLVFAVLIAFFPQFALVLVRLAMRLAGKKVVSNAAEESVSRAEERFEQLEKKQGRQIRTMDSFTKGLGA